MSCGTSSSSSPDRPPPPSRGAAPPPPPLATTTRNTPPGGPEGVPAPRAPCPPLAPPPCWPIATTPRLATPVGTRNVDVLVMVTVAFPARAGAAHASSATNAPPRARPFLIVREDVRGGAPGQVVPGRGSRDWGLRRAHRLTGRQVAVRPGRHSAGFWRDLTPGGRRALSG